MPQHCWQALSRELQWVTLEGTTALLSCRVDGESPHLGQMAEAAGCKEVLAASP